MIAVAADRIGVVVDNGVTEEFGSGLVLTLPRQFVEPSQTDQLRDLRIGVSPRQGVFSLRKRIEDAMVVELAREIEILLLLGSRVKLGKGVVHPAVFAGKHLLPKLGGEVFGRFDRPVPELPRDTQSLLV